MQTSYKQPGYDSTKHALSNFLKKGRIGAQTPKTPKQLERHLKGVANHWRIGILRLVAAQSGITLEVICKNLKGEYKTLSVHTQRLVHAGLVEKKYKGNSVEHFLTPYGKRFHDFLKAF